MKITALVENKSACGLRTAHGLSFYIITDKHKILFDMGPDETLFENAEKLGVDLSEIDVAFISHGHYDHGGALEKFLEINSKANVFIQKRAFERHACKVLCVTKDIGLDPKLCKDSRIVLVDGDYVIDDELELFTVSDNSKCHSEANDVLLENDKKDEFKHEQNLIIHGSKNVLMLGCGHNGIVNILEKAKDYDPQIVIGGYHLFNPVSKKSVSEKLLSEIANEMSKYDYEYYTCHCTGEKAYNYLSQKVKTLHYISCGESLEL